MICEICGHDDEDGERWYWISHEVVICVKCMWGMKLKTPP